MPSLRKGDSEDMKNIWWRELQHELYMFGFNSEHYQILNYKTYGGSSDEYQYDCMLEQLHAEMRGWA